MLRFYADRFVGGINLLHALEVLAQDPEWLRTPDKAAFVKSKLDPLIEHLKFMNLSMSLKKARNLEAALLVSGTTTAPANPATVTKLLRKFIEELRERIEDELDGKLLFFFDANAEYLDAKENLFGKAVEDAFGKATEDISEAGKCLALRRSTACVFHLMRVMELAVQALFTKLNLAGDPSREWGKLLSDIGGEIEKMPKGDRRNEWSASHSLLYHVKQAWRNDVMHPKQTYTDDEASEVFNAVKSFMRHLSGLV